MFKRTKGKLLVHIIEHSPDGIKVHKRIVSTEDDEFNIEFKDGSVETYTIRPRLVEVTKNGEELLYMKGHSEPLDFYGGMSREEEEDEDEISPNRFNSSNLTNRLMAIDRKFVTSIAQMEMLENLNWFDKFICRITGKRYFDYKKEAQPYGEDDLELGDIL